MDEILENGRDRVTASKEGRRDLVRLFIDRYHPQSDEKPKTAVGLQWQEVSISDPLLVPSEGILLDATICQSLADQLWDCGFRPSEGKGSAGSLAATQEHLADMKTLLFHQMKVK